MMKNIFSLSIAALAAALLAVACQAPAIEDIDNKDTEDIVVAPERTTVSCSLKLKDATKVSYEGGEFSFKDGDCLMVTCEGRDDVEGTLAYSTETEKWEGEVSWQTSEGEPGALVATLLHEDNTDVSSYGNAIVGATLSGEEVVLPSLQEAVENYSLFTADFSLDAEEGTLYQQAAFLEVNIVFDFESANQMGTAPTHTDVDLATSKGAVSGQTYVVPIQPEDPENAIQDYEAHFIVVVPSGQDVKDFTITICDRQVVFETSTILAANKKYSVSRTIEFKPELGDPFWSDGTFGRFEHNSDVSIVGIVVYANHNYEDASEAAIDDALTEKAAGFGHALVMALKNAAVGERWGTTSSRYTNSITKPSQTILVDNLSGYANTQAQAGENAPSLAMGYGPQYDGTTGWFLPSVGQWMYTISRKGFGGADPADQWVNNASPHKNWLTQGTLNDLVLVLNNHTAEVNLLIKSLNDRLQLLQDEYGIEYDAFGDPDPEANVSDNYWTSSEKDSGNAFRMNLGTVEQFGGEYYSTIKTKPESKTSTSFYGGYQAKIRPFLAF